MKRDTKIAGSVFAAIPLLILTLAVADTWLLAHGAAAAWRLPFRAICHGIPARCLQIWDVPMPICARCTAIYAGLAAGLVAFALLRPRGSMMRRLLIVAVIPLILDGSTQALRLRSSTNPLRVATGLAAGFAFGLWVLSTIEQSESRKFSSS